MQPPTNDLDAVSVPPPHQPTPESRAEVFKLTRLGMRFCDIAVALGIPQSTLRDCYRAEMSQGFVECTQDILSNLCDMASKGNTGAAIFLARARAGMGEIRELPFHSAPGDLPPRLADEFAKDLTQ